ncbi:hypothetical protein, partial [Escherichia coli]|uniref:hypothetical protein n=1 Tax=Escherichia coli TaxID=562 RepID=UPI001CCB4500
PAVSCSLPPVFNAYALPSEHLILPGQGIFRCLGPAVRSSLRCGTPQPELRRAVLAHATGAGIA